MKKNLRKLLAALLALILILSAVPALADLWPPIDDPIFIISPSFVISDREYISIPMSSEGTGEIKFVSTRKCCIAKDGYKEYFGFRVEDGKLILTNAEGVETEAASGEDGKGNLEIGLANGETFTAAIPRATLSYILNNGALRTENYYLIDFPFIIEPIFPGPIFPGPIFPDL